MINVNILSIGIIAAILCAIKLETAAQTPLSRWTHIPQAGDTLRQASFKIENFQLNVGNNLTWDFSNAKLADKEKVTVFQNANDNENGIFASDESYNYLYITKDDSLYLNMTESNLCKTQYRLPELENDFTMLSNQKRSKTFDGCYNYCDMHFYHVFGRKDLSMEGYGSIVLPSGKKETDVVLLHSKKISRYVPLPVIGDSLAWQYVTDLAYNEDSINGNLITGNVGTIITDVYKWYSIHKRYPVVERYVYNYSSSSTDCWYITYNDAEDNADICAHNLKSNGNGLLIGDVCSDYNTRQSINLGNVLISVKEKREDFLSVSFSISTKASCRYGLYGIDGKCIYEHEESFESGNYQRSVQIPNLPQGSYLLRLTSDGETKTMKISTKR